MKSDINKLHYNQWQAIHDVKTKGIGTTVVSDKTLKQYMFTCYGKEYDYWIIRCTGYAVVNQGQCIPISLYLASWLSTPIGVSGMFCPLHIVIDNIIIKIGSIKFEDFEDKFKIPTVTIIAEDDVFTESIIVEVELISWNGIKNESLDFNIVEEWGV